MVYLDKINKDSDGGRRIIIFILFEEVETIFPLYWMSMYEPNKVCHVAFKFQIFINEYLDFGFVF